MKRRQHGVTLMELLVVVAIVGLLAAIAVPGYRSYVIRANRADAKTGLAQLASQLERCYTNSTPYAYNSATCDAAIASPFMLPQGTYQLTAVRTAQTYTLTAVPQAGQAADSQCGNFILRETGAQAVTGTYAATPEQCWRR